MSICQKRTIRIFVIASLLLITAHRLPAPIQEIPQSPTPTPREKVEPASIRPNTPTPRSERKPPKKSGGTEEKDPRTNNVAAHPAATERNPKHFAGTWSGTMSQEDGQTYRVTVVIDPTETTATSNGPVFANEPGPVRINGNNLSWKWMLDSWSMTLKSDTTAQLVKHYLGSTHTGTITKTK